MSAYNLRLYRQTFHGIRNVLYPLVRDGVARVPPMQGPVTGLPAPVGICPASTLKAMGLHAPYKLRGGDGDNARARVLDALRRTGEVVFAASVERAARDDHHGDALDSFVAAFAAFRAMKGGVAPRGDGGEYAVEGYVYV
jgi:hypothetical protein